MEATISVISVSDLKRLLLSLTHQENQVCIRYRTIGQLWYPNFMRTIKIVQEKRVLFHDETRKRLISLPDFSIIIQFELDDKFYTYEPNCHYQVSDN
ncbi:MAG: hypothetical protein WD824_26530 [Cyclobacteriaceae bacterium]